MTLLNVKMHICHFVKTNSWPKTIMNCLPLEKDIYDNNANTLEMKKSNHLPSSIMYSSFFPFLVFFPIKKKHTTDKRKGNHAETTIFKSNKM